ncbi:MAG: transcription-repair coupling factor [Gemmataceae bacterium]
MESASSSLSTTTEPSVQNLQYLPQLLRGSEGFTEVVGSLEHGKAATIDGAWKSAAALAVTTLASACPKTLLVVLAHPGDLDGWEQDLHTFTGQRPVFFPPWDSWPPARSVVDEVAGQRLRVLKQLDHDAPPSVVFTTVAALLQPVPSREQLAQQQKRLRTTQQVNLDDLMNWLVERGYHRMEAVELPGEFSQRGGILDVFSPDAEVPYRIEFFGDEIDSIRQFSTESQRSLGEVEAINITAQAAWLGGSPMANEGAPPIDIRGHLANWLPNDSWVILHEPDELQEQAKVHLDRVSDIVGLFSFSAIVKLLTQFPSVHLTAMPSASLETTCHLRVESVERLSGDVAKVREELDSIGATDQVVIACHNEGSRNRLGEILAESQLARDGRLHLVLGTVHSGFRLVDLGIAVLGDHELFHREDVRSVLPRRQLESRAIDSFLELREGDLVVHVSHGIARYRGMELLEKHTDKPAAPPQQRKRASTNSKSPTKLEEHMILEFRNNTRIYVPVSKIDLVQKYVGGGNVEPELSKYGGTSWQRKKEKVEEAVVDLASDMIELQAVRDAQAGISYPSDSEWQHEFEAAFPYQETPDQLTALADLKRDMERPRPMDRLICGDVGYGKTEVAIRATFKTIDNGKQVAVLVPTTVLAEQHYRTFSQRFADYPFIVEGLNRFRRSADKRRIIEGLANGSIDVVIGTHRLLSRDVRFHDLGLVVIDEEQRFGVEHKEKLKMLRAMVDVLTLTATPIPRTLNLALLGIRDISNLETAPRDRLAIETRIVRWDEKLIRHAIMREFNREGQVYFVHNRVHNIETIAEQLQEIVPEATIVIAHGQMHENDLQQAMVQFVNGEADILVATTIIESGLDIPNANTIFINQADHYGLADLHQLRGRVGRYKHRAYAYLLLNSQRNVSPVASQRLKAIEEFTELGAGFKIAMRDLEIRGAGNILGNQQSGHIAAVGYEMYCQLLENAVRRLKKMPLRTPLEVTVDLPWTAYLPHNYVSGQKPKIEIYRRLSRIRKLERLEDFLNELRDRFGEPPEPVRWLLRQGEIRLLAAKWGIATVHLEGPGSGDPKYKNTPHTPNDVVFAYRHPRKMKKLEAQSDGRIRIVDEHSAYCRITPNELPPETLFPLLKHLLRPA